MLPLIFYLLQICDVLAETGEVEVNTVVIRLLLAFSNIKKPFRARPIGVMQSSILGNFDPVRVAKCR